MKKKVFIYGAAQLGIQIAWHINETYNLLGFIDTDPRKHTSNGGGCINVDDKDYIIYSPDILEATQIDKIFIGSEVDIHIKHIKDILLSYGINEEKIDTSFTFIPYYARLNFIKLLSLEFKSKKIKGSVAELGVFRGETAKEINRFFKNDTFYLLDTFKGFDIRDCENEKQQGLSKANIDDFSNTSLDYVKSRMPYFDKCIFIQGFFPKTSIQIPTDECFKFVNIDVDLYQPILAALEYFYPRMVDCGVILIHDYFHPYYIGVKRAVDEFCFKYSLNPIIIGDAFSIALIKNEG